MRTCDKTRQRRNWVGTDRNADQENGCWKVPEPTGLCVAKSLPALDSTTETTQITSLWQVEDALRASLDEQALIGQSGRQLREHLGDPLEVVPQRLSELRHLGDIGAELLLEHRPREEKARLIEPLHPVVHPEDNVDLPRRMREGPHDPDVDGQAETLERDEELVL